MLLHEPQSIITMHSNLLKEIERVDSMLAENTKKLAQRGLRPGDEKLLKQERKKLEKYKADLLAEWRHLNS